MSMHSLLMNIIDGEYAGDSSDSPRLRRRTGRGCDFL